MLLYHRAIEVVQTELQGHRSLRVNLQSLLPRIPHRQDETFEAIHLVTRGGLPICEVSSMPRLSVGVLTYEPPYFADLQQNESFRC